MPRTWPWSIDVYWMSIDGVGECLSGPVPVSIALTVLWYCLGLVILGTRTASGLLALRVCAVCSDSEFAGLSLQSSE
jgi:hypothetical protein